jgi:hypothetical protein
MKYTSNHYSFLAAKQTKKLRNLVTLQRRDPSSCTLRFGIFVCPSRRSALSQSLPFCEVNGGRSSSSLVAKTNICGCRGSKFLNRPARRLLGVPGHRGRGPSGQRTQSGAMTSDMKDRECVDCSTCAILKRDIPGCCPETRWGVDETIPISCKNQFQRDIFPEKDSPGVREDLIEDVASTALRLQRNAHTSRDITVMCARRGRSVT